MIHGERDLVGTNGHFRLFLQRVERPQVLPEVSVVGREFQRFHQQRKAVARIAFFHAVYRAVGVEERRRILVRDRMPRVMRIRMKGVEIDRYLTAVGHIAAHAAEQHADVRVADQIAGIRIPVRRDLHDLKTSIEPGFPGQRDEHRGVGEAVPRLRRKQLRRRERQSRLVVTAVEVAGLNQSAHQPFELDRRVSNVAHRVGDECAHVCVDLENVHRRQ